MRTHILYLLLLACLLGCRKEQTKSIFGETPDQRLAKALADYKSRLTGAEYGWKTAVFPAAGGGYSFYFTFDTAGRVNMYGDVTWDAAHTPQNSTYRLKAMQRPSLLFDTYSYLHLLADPDPNVYGGVTGQGYSVDFEYSIDSVANDTIKLTGITYSTKMILVKATKAEHDAYTTGQFGQQLTDIENNLADFPWQYLQFADGKKLQVSINTVAKNFTLIYLDDAGKVQLISTPYYYTTDGLYLQTPITYGTYTFNEAFWDADNQVFYIKVNGSRMDVQVADNSIIPMHLLLGVSFSSIVVPPQAIPGWSTDFTNMWKSIAASLKTGNYRLTLYYTYFTFDPGQQVLKLDVYIIQNNNLYMAEYPYTYTKTAAGVFDFTAQAYQGNAALIATDLAPLRSHLQNDHFTMDFFAGTLGQLKSVEDQGFYFTGYLE
ncbi:DUF4302 domain-containing protein [Chitinophaga sancti]|uniref:DUF4302 domain-containing protein n=1 Tax=Chitinophaga sancti TaxID=1004 RepID=A0A1K1N8T4_9BACT|nr:DUF4302 domain-containing protein [Chitinophaga sancti]WQD63449.1 DUF4302 domain-containing protein [Chitinophaga sancti]WQG90925.1 DUF4302 domain-containing protein [Chitinophaga sancti]SFW31840.1 protein of unknown function [Chitinophaga sancti]